MRGCYSMLRLLRKS